MFVCVLRSKSHKTRRRWGRRAGYTNEGRKNGGRRERGKKEMKDGTKDWKKGGKTFT